MSEVHDQLSFEEFLAGLAHDLVSGKILTLKLENPELVKLKLESDYNVKANFRQATLEDLEEGTKVPMEDIYEFLLDGHEFPEEAEVDWDEPNEKLSYTTNRTNTEGFFSRN